MAAEWTHHISYGPSYIAIFVHPWVATAENIKATKEFGVNLAAEGQNVISSVAGGSSGKEVDKIGALKELGVQFYEAKKIKALMIKGAAMNAECKVVKVEEIGDHIMFVGEVVEISAEENARPIVYHDGKYWKIGERILKSPEPELQKLAAIIQKHVKRGKGR